MAERADQPMPRGVAAAEGGHMIMGQGAVPIIRNGVVEGACGVTGGTAQQDEDCARAGAKGYKGGAGCASGFSPMGAGVRNRHLLVRGGRDRGRASSTATNAPTADRGGLGPADSPSNTHE